MAAWPASFGLRERFDAQWTGEPNSGCWLWVGSCLTSEYGMIMFERERRLAHRTAWELYRGPIPDGLFVLHKCDIPSCVNPMHLFLGTHKGNSDDKVRKGRQGRGSDMSSLSASDVLEIRMIAGWSHSKVAVLYNVTRKTIDNIINQATWRHI